MIFQMICLACLIVFATSFYYNNGNLLEKAAVALFETLLVVVVVFTVGWLLLGAVGYLELN